MGPVVESRETQRLEQELEVRKTALRVVVFLFVH